MKIKAVGSIPTRRDSKRSYKTIFKRTNFYAISQIHIWDLTNAQRVQIVLAIREVFEDYEIYTSKDLPGIINEKLTVFVLSNDVAEDSFCKGNPSMEFEIQKEVYRRQERS